MSELYDHEAVEAEARWERRMAWVAVVDHVWPWAALIALLLVAGAVGMA